MTIYIKHTQSKVKRYWLNKRKTERNSNCSNKNLIILPLIWGHQLKGQISVKKKNKIKK